MARSPRNTSTGATNSRKVVTRSGRLVSAETQREAAKAYVRISQQTGRAVPEQVVKIASGRA